MQTKQQKEVLVQEVVDKIKDSKALVFANYQGVNVKDITELRRELRKSGSGWQVLKKTLLNIALKNAGVEVNSRELSGQIGVAYSKDEVVAAKPLSEVYHRRWFTRGKEFERSRSAGPSQASKSG